MQSNPGLWGTGRLVGVPALTVAADTAPSTSPPPSLAVVVGINRAGPGQTELRFAEDDARPMAALLASLGRYQPGKVELLLWPTLGEVRRAAARFRISPSGPPRRADKVPELPLSIQLCAEAVLP